MKRIGIAQIWQESNHFNPVLTRIEDFRRYGLVTGQRVIDELMEKLPDFKTGYLEDGLTADEFEDFGPVQLFKKAFTTSWTRALEIFRDRRAEL